jgi:hypothetical protein
LTYVNEEQGIMTKRASKRPKLRRSKVRGQRPSKDFPQYPIGAATR